MYVRTYYSGKAAERTCEQKNPEILILYDFSVRVGDMSRCTLRRMEKNGKVAKQDAKQFY